jgi:diguanylate cyclase (GGDEF)-like protein/PAS domain S-box-containing protein
MPPGHTLMCETHLRSKLCEDIIRSFPECVYVVDEAGKFKQWNSTFEKLLGYTAQEIAEIAVLDTIAEEQREIVQEATATALTGGLARVESVLVSKDGTRIPCLLTGARVVLDDQPCLLGIAVDLTKLRQAEESLRASEEEYESLIASIPEVVWKSDSVGGVGFVGPGIETILGYSPAEVYQRGDSVWYDSIHVDDRQRVKQAFESLLNEGKPYDVECRVQRKSGEWFWAHGRAVTTGEKDGIRFATGLLSDITERKASEETLRKLASIVELSEDAITVINTDGVITSWNPAAERMYGHTRAEAIGRDLSLIVPPERKAEKHAIIERVVGGRAIKTLETQRLTKAGHLIDVSLSATAIEDGSGRIAGVATISRDITLRKRSEEQLRLQSTALESAANGIVITDRVGIIIWVNDAVTTMTGYSREELLGKNSRVLKSGNQPESYYADLWSTISSGKVWHGEVVNKRKDGTTYAEEMTITPVTQQGSDTTTTHFIAIKQDITGRKQAEELLRQREAMLNATGEMAKVGGWELDLSTNELTWTREVYRIHEVDEGFVPNVERAIEFYTPECRPLIEQAVKGAIEYGEPFDLELQIETAKNKRLWVKALGQSRTLNAGRRTLFGTFQDITERRQSEERVQYLAYYDALTDLPNRTLLADRLSTAVASARRHKDKVALLFLDLDHFKSINDSFGHSFGDLVLQDVAKRLKKVTREQDTVARLGGDEFLVVLNNVKDISDAADAAERFMGAMTAEFVVQGHSLGLTCSLGISIFPDHGMDVETLLKHADAAMYSAKENGRNSFQFFAEEMTAQVVERLTLENCLRPALEKKQLFLVYQPQMDLATGKIIGLEALLRWQHPELGLVPPDKFIGIAENSGLILPIGEWVLRTACSQARKWQDEGLSAVRVAVNVSAVQFRQPDFCAIITRVLHETGLAPQYLELELTESLLLSSADVTLSVIQELSALGVALAIDDFGTGYSNFGYLRQFRVNRLKIDRSFINNVAVNPDDAAIANAIISMAKSMSLKVIAEGVENEAQMSFLRSHLCDEIQGYYFSKPLTVDKVADKLRGDGLEPLVRAQASGGQSSQG